MAASWERAASLRLMNIGIQMEGLMDKLAHEVASAMGRPKVSERKRRPPCFSSA